MNGKRWIVMASVLLLLPMTGCADLDIVNNNNPDTDRLLSKPGDIESLIASQYWTVRYNRNRYEGMFMAMSNMADEHTTNAANAMQLDLYTEPRSAIQNTASYSDKMHIETIWYGMYAAIKAAYDGLTRITGPDALEIIDNSGVDQTPRARAFAKLIQGMAHGTLAQVYDRAWIVDETVPTDESGALVLPEMQRYDVVMQAAIGYLDEAIAIAQANDFTIPASKNWIWAESDMTSADFIRFVNSWAAIFETTVARTPEERAHVSAGGLVDWADVIDRVDNGIDDTFMVFMDDQSWIDWVAWYTMAPGWGYWDNRYLAYADTTGNAAAWLATPMQQRTAIDIASPDLRFPQTTDGMGTYVWHFSNDFLNPICCQKPERGTYNHSRYMDRRDVWADYLANWITFVPELDIDGMNLIKAEALYRLNGATQEVVDLINITRQGNGGLPALTTAGVPGSMPGCVPHTEAGACGDVFDALKYEKRVEVYEQQLGDWFFDSRGWGDLYEGTFLQVPVPAKELELLGEPVYTFGGVGGNCAAGSSTCDALSDDPLADVGVELMPLPAYVDRTSGRAYTPPAFRSRTGIR